MNNTFSYTTAIEDRMFVKDVRLDFYGDDLLKVNFAYTLNVDDSMQIIKVDERKKYDSFRDTMSLN